MHGFNHAQVVSTGAQVFEHLEFKTIGTEGKGGRRTGVGEEACLLQQSSVGAKYSPCSPSLISLASHEPH